MKVYAHITVLHRDADVWFYDFIEQFREDVAKAKKHLHGTAQ